MELELTRDQILNLIEEKNIQALRSIVETFPPIDLADIVQTFQDSKDILFLFKTCSSDRTAELFTYLNPETQKKLIDLFTDKQILELLNHSYSDDIADFLGELPANLVTRILKNADSSFRDELNQLLLYKEGTAGSLMTPEYITIPKQATVREAIKKIRSIGKEKETIQSTFVIDAQRYLIGVLSLESLIYHEEDERIQAIMKDDFKTCHVYDHVEDVASMFKRYDLTVLPVLNETDRLVGIITIDDVIDVIEDAASEDILKMAALTPLEQSYQLTTPFEITKKSIPWILGLMVIGAISTITINQFEDVFEQVIILTAFIPMIMNTGGNAGNQSIALITRALATQDITPADTRYLIKKELQTSFYVAAITSAFAFVWIFVLLWTGIVQSSRIETPSFVFMARISGLVSLTLFVSIFVAKMLGSLLPLFAIKIKKDPAIMSSPFLTTIMDFTSLLVYFLLANFLFNFF